MLDTIRVTVSLSPIIHISVVSFSISKDLMEKKKIMCGPLIIILWSSVVGNTGLMKS